MVCSGLALTDTLILKTGKRWENVDRWLNLLTIKITGENNLSLCDISCKVRNWVSLIILRHGKDRDHSDRSVLSVLTACTLIHSSKVSIHITRISTTSRNFLTGCGYLTKSICIVCNICKDNKYVHSLFESKELRCGKCHLRSSNTLYSRVICKVHKENCSVDSSCLLEGLYEVVRLFKGNTHSSKYNRKWLICSYNLCLTCNLCSKFSMWKT